MRHSNHLTINDALRLLAQGGNESNRSGCLYMETGPYKPFATATIWALRRRGYRVDDLCPGVFLLHPKAAHSTQEA